MKNLLIFAVIVLVAQVGYTQVAGVASALEPKASLAVADVDNQNFDFGKIKQGVPVTHEFSFVNKGTVPMIIIDVRPSCGCTTPSWTKDPIPPGGQGFVKATYNSASMGAFDKTVTVTANVETGIVMLRIRGEVVQEL